jgi:tRNA-2-methylthio-N6-dimethylallyladenosine synthase
MGNDRQNKNTTPHLRTGNEDCIDTPDVSPGRHLTPEGSQKVFLKTFGCQMNEYDSEQVGARLLDGGYELVAAEDDADIILFNTCSVRAHAEERVLGRLRMLAKRKAENRALIIGVMGCMANAYKEQLLKDFPQLDFISGTKDFGRIVEILNGVISERTQKAYVSETDGYVGFSQREFEAPRLRAYVPIMRGCDNFCSYCIVPYVRGREASRPSDEVLAEISFLAARGVKEIMLLGQNVNSYGKGLTETIDFPDLLRRVADTPGIEIIRFMTSHPKDVSLKLFELMRDEAKIEKHLHLPLQSGSDGILQAMNRGYTFNEYQERIVAVRECIPDVSITTDIIVGFCGETEADYLKTRRAFETIQFDSAFIFKYSPRSGTHAYHLQDTVSEEEKLRRNNDLLDLQRHIQERKNQALIGRRERALVYGRSKKKKDELKAKTLYDREIVFPGSKELVGEIVELECTGLVNQTFTGRLIQR